MKQHIPWQAKIIAKVILARLPFSYQNWAALNLFRHGAMADPAYARTVFALHIKDAFGEREPPAGLTYLEMGTGDSVASAVFAAALGAKKTYLVDVGDFITRDMAFYRQLDDRFDNFDDMMEYCHATYLTDGLSSLKTIPDNSVDFIWSHATLEHVRHAEFDETMNELYRIIKPGGVMSHEIDLKDHLGGKLNNLRFSPDLWESEWMATSGFYTNRLRPYEMADSMRQAGFTIEEDRRSRWDALPTPRSKMAAPFKDQPEDELLTQIMNVRLRK